MRSLELLRLVWINTWQNKAKVLLTSLGIIVGTATIVLVTAIGDGAKLDAVAQFSSLSADTIFINPDYAQMSGGFDSAKMEKLSIELMQAIADENPYINGIAMRSSTTEEIRAGKTKEYMSVAGVTEQFLEVLSIEIGAGGGFAEQDFESGEKVALLGSELADKLFGSAESAVGQRIKAGEHSLKIIGVLRRSADGLQGMNHDATIYIPYKTLEKCKLQNDYMMPQIIAKADALENVKRCMQMMRGTMEYLMDTPKTYTVEDAGSRIDAATQSARTMSMLLTSVAMIVLTVGGIGIMNVLFVTVKERTREIGVLKALGCKNTGILLQFLTESVFIGIFGGLAGLMLSAVVLKLMPLTGMTVAPSVQGFVLAFVFAVLTSASFGFYPAYQASRLRPVDALAYE